MRQPLRLLLGGVRHTCENVLEGELDVASVQGRRFDEGQVVLACR